MVIVAHPDDAEFGAAGTVCGWTDRGVEVTYVICTDGSAGGVGDASLAEMAELRQREQRNAAAVVGVKEVIFLGYPDGYLDPSFALRKELSRLIRVHRPEVVITHMPVRGFSPIGTNHPDHLAAGEAAYAAVYPQARNPRAYPEFLAMGLEAHTVKEIWSAAPVDADHFVDICATVERKIEALLCHVSQMRDPGAMPRWITDRARAAGLKAGMEYAESFKRVIAG